MTKLEIIQLEEKIARYNDEKQLEAKAKFDNGPIPKMKWVMNQTLERLLGRPFPSPEDLPDPGIKPVSPALQAAALPSEPPEKPNGKSLNMVGKCFMF